jgi:membrane protease YdiL (CAAX protease family)
MANGEGDSPASQEITPAGRVTPVAPVWHTLLLVAVLLGLAVLQGQPQLAKGAQLPSRITLYLFTVAYEFFLLGYVWLLGLRRSKVTLGEIIGGKWLRWGDFWRDVGIALLFWIVVGAVLVVMSHALHFSGIEAAKFLLPETATEVAVFVLLSCIAGFCEEIVFRGYLQRQFTAWTRNVVAGIVLQSAVFASLPGVQRRGGDYGVRRAVWYFGVDAKEPAPGNYPARRARFPIGNRGCLPEEVSLLANHQVLKCALRFTNARPARCP